jgi:hypothetical protein
VNAVRSDDTEPEQPPGVPLAPALLGAVTFVPEGFTAPTVGVPVVNGHYLHPGCPDCDGGGGE